MRSSVPWSCMVPIGSYALKVGCNFSFALAKESAPLRTAPFMMEPGINVEGSLK